MSDNATATLISPSWLNSGDNAWQMTAATLVGLQSIPGLVALYGGIVKTKFVLNTAFMCFYGFAMTLLIWCIWGYEMSFGKKMIPGVVGLPRPIMSSASELKQANLPSANITPAYEMSAMVYFQFVFAAITVLLIAGGVLERMNFKAWMIFVPLWLTFSYTIGAYSIWGGGWAFQYGVIDYSGGYVIHVTAGTAAFVAAFWVGPRRPEDRHDRRPSNMLMTLIGTGLLWLGWNGFNGGDPYAADPDAGAAVLNTNLCTAVSMLSWMFMDMIFHKRPSIEGMVQGIITGLVAITPAAGVIAGWGAIIFGVFSGTIPWVSYNILNKKVAFFRNIDDALGVFHTHAVTGILGGFLTGIFATSEGVAAFALTTPGGGITGYGIQIGKQLAGACFIFGWNVVWTSIVLLFIKYVCRVPLRMTEHELLVGDEAIYGEVAYNLADIIAGAGHTEEMQHAHLGHPIIDGHGTDLEQGISGSPTHAKQAEIEAEKSHGHPVTTV